MLLMKGNQIIARVIGEPGQMGVVRPEPDVNPDDLPWEIFWDGKVVDAPMERLVEWAEDRVMPEDRIGVEEILKELGLTRYDPWDIVKRTGAKASYLDDYWIDFEGDTSVLFGVPGWKP